MSENEQLSETQYAGNAYNTVNMPNAVFHAVYMPRENDEAPETDIEDKLHVYQDKAEALKLIKTYKTARFKTFKTWAEAEEYARTGFEKHNQVNITTQPPTANATEEKSNNFKGPKSQDLVCFRKLVESGDLEAVKSTIWGNPRYLISTGDTPAILQEGCRYNALHVAVKADKPEMCELILNTVGDAEFIKLLYGEEECKCYVDRAEIMLDLYLNTPDKGLNETPLHFAVKFGLKDVVRVLVSYPQCEKRLRNKYKQCPIDIICARKCQNDEKLKLRIRALLEDQYYVPVLRSEDNTLQPVIGEPFSPSSPMSFKTDPISPRVEVRAFAGPMTKSRAMEFRKKWKTPPRLQSSPLKKLGGGEANNMDSVHNSITLRLQDAEKGLERVGRDLAQEYQVSWKEYWPFLDDFADFRCAEGLTKLEKYFAKKYMNRPTFPDKENSTDSYNLNKSDDINNDIDFICNKLESYLIVSPEDPKNMLDNGSDDLEFYTPPSSPKLLPDSSDDEMETAEEGPAMYIKGSVPSKLDYAVLNALPSSIDVGMYPNIYRWRHDMQLTMERDSSRSNMRTIRRKLLMNY